MAIGLLNALQEGGLSVPQDVALAGFDDIPLVRYIFVVREPSVLNCRGHEERRETWIQRLSPPPG